MMTRQISLKIEEKNWQKILSENVKYLDIFFILFTLILFKYADKIAIKTVALYVKLESTKVYFEKGIIVYLPIVTGCVKTPETSLLSESRISSSEGSGLPVKFHQALMFLAVLRRGFKIFSCISHLSTKKIYFSIEIALLLVLS
jgi:hypothetical protein